ncbi:MAG TPA: hypothetical protein VK716_06655 [Terracidiphilus sp.]|jgi:Rod binding domain-containing protein|nr:hypothetical protein [Terracidiphilus sp.]
MWQLQASPATPATPTQGMAQPRLVRAAHEFEAQMMKELLGPLVGESDSEDGSEDFGSSSNALGSFATEALGNALSEQGGIGIADRILKDLSQRGKDSQISMVRERNLSGISPSENR